MERRHASRHGPYAHHLQGREIRLVLIHPGDWADDIRCSLTAHSPDGASLPEYSALSYAWGASNTTEIVTLEDEALPVTVSLANALRFLRHSISPTRMWIDALCINQRDPIERSRQVELMRDNYSSCGDVTVFLGDGRNHRPRKGIPRSPGPLVQYHGDERDQCHIQAFWDALSDPPSSLSRYHFFSFLRVMGDTKLAPVLWRKVKDAGWNTVNTLVEELRMMMLSPWWQRVWVVQEMIVSATAIVRYGAFQAPWRMLVSAASAHPPSMLPQESAKVLDHFARQVQTFEHLRDEWRAAGGAPLLTLLQDFSARRSSDERDKVYALLGIVTPKQRTLVRPDYLASVPEVYRDTTISLIRHSKALNLWGGDLTRKNRMGLQSYVPDWSAVYQEADRRRAQVEGAYNACGSWKLQLITSQNEYWRFVRQGHGTAAKVARVVPGDPAATPFGGLAPGLQDPH
ncbi:heterokaryon incompatibility protein-domain-containing protein [Podospora aff. communis PSN243]|uniref:Heterokaryon incompatibility protein-domain-containing protein n=1 Tax=Podospora aff. communis PSN243 TaxID=3040156 RepID=A0AAV9GSX3_9PEZI|nr:heterokaryon incompatibility protein-domain-containing protein [Podospora aff. communis PSN243]